MSPLAAKDSEGRFASVLDVLSEYPLGESGGASPVNFRYVTAPLGLMPLRTPGFHIPPLEYCTVSEGLLHDS
jgi:hypothetical protein